jgi:hypothetical protein
MKRNWVGEENRSVVHSGLWEGFYALLSGLREVTAEF